MLTAAKACMVSLAGMPDIVGKKSSPTARFSLRVTCISCPCGWSENHSDNPQPWLGTGDLSMGHRMPAFPPNISHSRDTGEGNEAMDMNGWPKAT